MTATHSGTVIDRMTGRKLYASRPTTWAIAQDRAERAARRCGYGHRCQVVVVELATLTSR